MLKWVANSPAMVKRYVIERSADKQVFEKINEVDPATTVGIQNYSAIDATPLEGDNFYASELYSMMVHSTTLKRSR